MKAFITTAILAATITTAHADEWTGPDKMKHAIAGAATGGFFTLVTKDPNVGCAAAVVVGAGKEVFDATQPAKHTASFKDFAVTAAAGCLAAHVTGLTITPRKVTYKLSMNFL